MNSRTSRTVALAAIGAALLSGTMFTALPVRAQTVALPRADVVEQLGARFDEAQTAVGLTQEGGVIEVFATNDGSTWTLVLTKPDGTSRVVAAGKTWIRW